MSASGTATTITQYGITFTFDQSYECLGAGFTRRLRPRGRRVWRARTLVLVIVVVLGPGTALAVTHPYARPSLPARSYDPPAANVLFVDGAATAASPDGSMAAPFATIGAALTAVNGKPAGPTWTVVIKQGIYREGALRITRDNVTVQRYQTDAVSLYGSASVSAFSGTGPYVATLTVDTAAVEVDCADTSLLGQSGRHYKSEQAFSVIRAGVPLERVDEATTPQAGQYTYDGATHVLTLADAPAEVEVVVQNHALRATGSDVTLAGLDFENYGSCTLNWSKVVGQTTYYSAAVMIYKDTVGESGSTMVDCTVANNAAAGVALANGAHITVKDSNLVNNGWNGLKANVADGLVVQNNSLSFNNFRRWKNTTEAGMKITYIHDGVIVDNLFEHNASNGFWCDEGCGATDPATRWFIVARNVVRFNDDKGLFYEVSHHSIIASNLVHDNATSGIAAFGSRNVQIWNNTAVNNNASTAGFQANIAVVDDSRCFAGDTLPGQKSCTAANGVPLMAGNQDHCEPSSNGALANTCNAEHAVIQNNLISGTPSTRPLLDVDDPGPTRYGAALIADASDFQAYWRPDAATPTTLIGWQTQAGSAEVSYASLDAFRAANPNYEQSSVERTGEPHPYFVDYAGGDYRQNMASNDVWGRGAMLPPEVSLAVFWPDTSGTQPSPLRIGAIAFRQDVPTGGGPDGGVGDGGPGVGDGGAVNDGGVSVQPDAATAGSDGGAASGHDAVAGGRDATEGDVATGSHAGNHNASGGGCQTQPMAPGGAADGRGGAALMIVIALAVWRRRLQTGL